MKTFSKLFILLGILSLLIGSCKKDDNSSDSRGFNGNTIKGTIKSWSMGEGKVLKAYDDYGNQIGQATIAANGAFSLTLSTPQYHDILGTDVPTGITVSDPTAGISVCQSISVYNSEGIYIGDIEFGHDVNDGDAGSYYGMLCHLTKSTTIKGTTTETNFQETFNVNFKAGWNVMISQLGGTTSNPTLTYSTTIPSTAEWVFYSK